MNRLMGRTQRLREIENLLFRSSQGVRINELADECGVNRRTVYRDIKLLEETGVPIWQDGSHYGIVRDQYLATIHLKFNEAVAVYIAARLLARHADEHNPHIISALTKLATAFPDPLADYITRTADVIRHQHINSSFVANLEVIAGCWAELHKVRVWYRSPRSGVVRPRDLSPYTLEPSTSGGLYVIGHDEWSNQIRTFKIDRLERAERLPQTYVIPPSFDPGSHFASAWGIMSGTTLTTVVLHFSPTVASLIRERLWHASQILEALDDGWIRFIAQVAEPDEMRPWIRSWGAEVVVVEPPALRADIAAEAHRLSALYGGCPS